MNKINLNWFIFLYNYFMRRYIGNKEKLLHEIEKVILDNNIEAETLTDLYAGTGSVSDYFKSRYRIVANDIMFYSYVVLKAKLSFKEGPKFQTFVKKYNKDPIDYLNDLKIVKSNKCIIWNNFSPKGGRKYFTEDNALKIDMARIEIDSLRDEGSINMNEWYYLLAVIISAANSKGNTTGTFGAYLKSFSTSSYKEIVFSRLEIRVGNIGKVYCEDGIKILNKTKGDILYLDPPYTAIDYSQAYHFLESLALYDTNEYKGITGRRIDNNKVSNYTKERTAINEFTNTIEMAANYKNVILSYSSHGIMSKAEILKILKKYYNDVTCKEIKYTKYRNVYSNDKGLLEEYIFCAKERKNEANS